MTDSHKNDSHRTVTHTLVYMFLATYLRDLHIKIQLNQMTDSHKNITVSHTVVYMFWATNLHDSHKKYNSIK